MDFEIPTKSAESLDNYKSFLNKRMTPYLSTWYGEGSVPRSFFEEMGSRGLLAYTRSGGAIVEESAVQQALWLEELSRISPGVAVAVLVQISLGMKGLVLFGSDRHKEALFDSASQGKTLLCVGNTEPTAGSDVASIATRAEPVEGGWLLNGVKAFVTNALISDYGLITAIADPEAPRNKRLSMFLVDLRAEGITRRKLHKQVWIPSDLTRIQMKDVFVPEENLVGTRGKGLQQVLEIFTNSRLTISALTLGTAVGAFDLALNHAGRREIFGKKILDYQAKAFEAADFYSKIEASRLAVWKACWMKDQGKDFRMASSIAKYLTVEVARTVGVWAADIFGAASVVFEHPIHKFPMDAWAASLGEGTQDVQKLIIIRELLKERKEEKIPQEAALVR
jgi:alkylation response protein AidB-like acyl-CoA dehydrogenase